MKILGARRRPRILVIGFDDDVVAAVKALAPTVERFNSLGQVQQDEWDALVIQQPNPTSVAEHLAVLTLGPTAAYTAWGGDISTIERAHTGAPEPSTIIGGHIFRGSEFIRPAACPPALAALVDGALCEAAIRKAGENVTLEVRDPQGQPSAWETSLGSTPILCGSEGSVLAGIVRRAGNKADCWILPWYMSDPTPFVAVALSEWRQADPGRFRPAGDWRNAPEWQSTGEREVALRLIEAVKDEAASLRSLRADQERLNIELSEAREAAEQGTRRLLDRQGDALSRAVAEALQSLGFEVKQMDPHAETIKAQKLEDLQVRVSGQEGWVALVEVRGHKGGAKTSDFQRIGRFVERYIKVEDAEPDRRWYIVNQFIERPPNDRPRPFEASPEDLASFAESGGLVIDTVDLFRLVRDVEANRISKVGARESLMEAVGLFSYAEGSS